MGNKLYVGNLPYSVRDNDLEQAFSSFGQVVSARVMMERDTGRSKGFGFVEMGSQEEANAAVEGMNGQALGGRNVVVNEARPMEARPRTGGYGAELSAIVQERCFHHLEAPIERVAPGVIFRKSVSQPVQCPSTSLRSTASMPSIEPE